MPALALLLAVVFASAYADAPDGASDVEAVACLPTCEVVRGTLRPDFIRGTGGREIIFAKAGGDKVYAGGGADVVYGEAGDDFVSGGRGADWLRGGLGDDLLRGGQESDHLFGGSGNDVLDAEDDSRDADQVSCGAGFDRVRIDWSDPRPGKDCERVDIGPVQTPPH